MGRPITNPYSPLTRAKRDRINELARQKRQLHSVAKAKKQALDKIKLADRIEQGITASIEKILTAKGGIKAYQIKELVAVAKGLRKDAEDVLHAKRGAGEEIPPDLAAAAARAGVKPANTIQQLTHDIRQAAGGGSHDASQRQLHSA